LTAQEGEGRRSIYICVYVTVEICRRRARECYFWGIEIGRKDRVLFLKAKFMNENRNRKSYRS